MLGEDSLHALPHGNNGKLAILVRVNHDRLELAVEWRERDTLMPPLSPYCYFCSFRFSLTLS